MMFVALMARPSECAQVAIPNLDAVTNQNPIIGRLKPEIRTALETWATSNEVWNNLLGPVLRQYNAPGIYSSAHARIFSGLFHAPRELSHSIITFLNTIWQEWWDMREPMSEDDAYEEVANGSYCDTCDHRETCDDRCEGFWDAVAATQDENTEWNMDWLNEEWNRWQEEFAGSPPEITILTPEIIGQFEAVPYMARDCSFSAPYQLEGDVTIEQLRNVAALSGRYPTQHLMNLWCRMRLAVSEELDEQIDNAQYKPSLWGTRAAATAVLAQDRHQQYMRENGVGWEVNYGLPATD